MKTSKRALLLLLVLFTFALTSCDKDEEQNTTPGTPTFALSDFFSQTQAPFQTFQVDAATGGQITGTKGTKISFYANSFQTKSGQAVTGTITVTLREMLKGSDMILSNMTTTTNGQLLISGGQIYLKAVQGSNELELKPGAQAYVQIPTDNPATMNVYTGELVVNDSLIGDTTINWTLADTNVWVGQDTTAGPATTYYNFTIDSVGWTNCDYFYSSPNPLTNISVVCPAQHVDSNTVVYLYFPTINSVTRMYYDSADARFELAYGYEIPEGLSLKVVVISQIGTQYYYEILPQTITTNLVVNSTPAAATLAQVQAAVQNL